MFNPFKKTVPSEYLALAQPIAFCVLDLIPEIRRAKLVRFVTNDQVPVALLEFGLGVFVAA